MIRNDAEIQCPYCGEKIWMEFYPEDGLTQEMVIDCEICCKPIQYIARFEQKDDGEYDMNVQVERSQ